MSTPTTYRVTLVGGPSDGEVVELASALPPARLWQGTASYVLDLDSVSRPRQGPANAVASYDPGVTAWRRRLVDDGNGGFTAELAPADTKASAAELAAGAVLGASAFAAIAALVGAAYLAVAATGALTRLIGPGRLAGITAGACIALGVVAVWRNPGRIR